MLNLAKILATKIADNDDDESDTESDSEDQIGRKEIVQTEGANRSNQSKLFIA